MEDDIADPKHFADVERLSFAQHRNTARPCPTI